MNKKGFTVVELTVSFSLVSVIAVMLFNLIFSLKELYESGDIKTSLLNKQAIMDKKIYEDLNTRDLKSITACGISCLTFEYVDGNAKLLIDVGANTITYDNYTMKLNKGTKIEQVSFDTYSYTSTNLKDNAVFHLDIPIKTTLLDDDFGIHIIKTYNTGEISINKQLAFNEATIIANGVTMPLTLIDQGEDWNIALDSDNRPNISTLDTDNKVIFAHIFHQEQGTYFDDYKSFLKSKDNTKTSTLKSLEIFRNKKRATEIADILKEVEEKEKDKKAIDEEFSNGYFELIIDYPGFNNAGAFKNYNRWIQTSNFTNNKKIEGGLFVDTINSGNQTWQNGLRYINSTENYVTGSNNNTLFTIGMKKDIENDNGYTIKNPDGTSATSVDIWVRANEYIEKYGLVTLVY